MQTGGQSAGDRFEQREQCKGLVGDSQFWALGLTRAHPRGPDLHTARAGYAAQLNVCLIPAR